VRILYFSDVHCEIREGYTRLDTGWTKLYPLALGPDLTDFVHSEPVDACILAGDIAHTRETRGVSTLLYAQQVHTMLACPVIVVPGNHEYYGGSFEEDRADLLAAASVPGVTVLDRHESILPFGDRKLRVLGATLWTDYALTGDKVLGMMTAAQSLNDHRMIKLRSGHGRPRMFTPRDAHDEHMASRTWLLERLDEPFEGETILVSHHVPHSHARHPAFPMDPVSCCFMSDCTDVIEKAAEVGAKAWIFGHHHWSLKTDLFGVKLLAAQYGYPRENSNWSGVGVLEL
jgi:DNA repair exonuclease SbcCD nuclease subunit